MPSETSRAAAVAPLDSNRQRIVADSRKPIDGPSTDTRVPPDTGPAGGTSALTNSAPCTKKLPPLRKGAPWLHSSMLDHPVGSAGGEKQRIPSEP